jgi:hypothetical protein
LNELVVVVVIFPFTHRAGAVYDAFFCLRRKVSFTYGTVSVVGVMAQ